MAAWCVLTGFPPDVYKQLTVLERNEFIEVVKKQRSR
jgi:hypothetical protein